MGDGITVRGFSVWLLFRDAVGMNTIYRLLWIIVFLCAFKLAVGGAHAHSWYDRDCCSHRDCFSVVKMMTRPDGTLFLLNNGEQVMVSNYYFGLLQRAGKLRASKDDNWHVCYRDYKFGHFNERVAECVYSPAGS